MFTMVSVAEYDILKYDGVRYATRRSELDFVNFEYIFTCTNKKVPNSDIGTCEVCTIGLVTGETIDVYGQTQSVALPNGIKITYQVKALLINITTMPFPLQNLQNIV